MTATGAAAADPKARAFLRKADPVLERLIDARPDFRPRAWLDELPPLDGFGALIFQVAGQQLSVQATRSIVSRHYRPGMDPHDAAALFWWARTSLFFDLRLDQRPDVRLCSYERLIADPEGSMRSLYEFMGVAYPERAITQGVHRRSVGRGNHFPLSAEVRQLCDRLWERLEGASSGSR
jgi:hypothetical protein